jgi:hypothetical protein
LKKEEKNIAKECDCNPTSVDDIRSVVDEVLAITGRERRK